MTRMVLDGLPAATLRDDAQSATSWAQIASAPQIYASTTSMVTAAEDANRGEPCPSKTLDEGVRAPSTTAGARPETEPHGSAPPPSSRR